VTPTPRITVRARRVPRTIDLLQVSDFEVGDGLLQRVSELMHGFA